MSQLNDYEQKILAGWEDVHNKSQLSMWILLSLKDGPKHMALIKQFIMDATNQLLVPDDKSMYRALRRFNDSELIVYGMTPSLSGPDLKVYVLSQTGSSVLKAFLERNIFGILYKPSVRHLIEKG